MTGPRERDASEEQRSGDTFIPEHVDNAMTMLLAPGGDGGLLDVEAMAVLPLA